MSFFLQVHRFHKKYTAQLTSLLAPYELSNSNWSLLNYLVEKQVTTTSQIAKYWDVEKPTVSANVKVLMQLGLIQTKQGEDKREKYLSLTEKGEKLHKKISPEIKNLQNDLLSVLTERQKDDIQQGLFDMEVRLKEDYHE
jgi:MarR family transcriptional regulator, transcriptional regulator for hemolysin